MYHRPYRPQLKHVLVGDKIIIRSFLKSQGVEMAVTGMVTSIKPLLATDGHLRVVLGKSWIDGLHHEDDEVQLLSSLLRDEGIAMVVGGSPTFNITYVRDGRSLYRITYDWMTDKATRTTVDTIPEDEQRLETVGKNQSNRESKTRICMNVPLTTETR